MNSLEGWKTNGHEYRASEIDRNNSRRIKWMNEELKKRVEQNSKENMESDSDKNLFNNKKELEERKDNSLNNDRNMFNPNVNSYAKFNTNNFK